MRKLLLLSGLVAMAVAIPGAVDNPAWFGTPGPAPLSDPRKPVMKYDDAFPPLPAQFKSRPGKPDELLSGAALKADQKKIVGFSLESLGAGDKVWGRRAATPAFQHTIEWAVSEFKAAGLKDARVEPFAVTASMWVPQSWQLQLIGDPAFGAGTQTVTLQSAFPQPGGASIPGGILTAPVVYVGHGTDADLAGRDLKGKIAIVRVRPEPSLFGAGEQGVAARLVEKGGAAGVINAIEGPGNAQYIDPRFACGKSPCFMVGGQDAWFLQTVIGKAAGAGMLDKLKIAMSLTSKEEGGLTSANGIATIPGESATRIIVNAHADGYFQGGDDNASGLAVLVGLARYFAKQPKPKHTLMFVASGGHHGPGNGPGALVAAHPELKTGTLLILNLEHVAYADVVRGKVRAADNIGMTWETSVTESAKAVGVTNQSPFLFDLWKQASRCYGVATYQSAGTTVSGDLGGYRPIEAPMTQMIQSGTFYHSSGDVYEEVPAEGIERAARFHAFLIEQVDKAPEGLITAGKGIAVPVRDQGVPVRISDFRFQISGALLGLLVLQGSAQSPAFTYQKVMIPVRDGVKLETVIMAPANATGPLPILFRRTPYGVPANADGIADGSLKALARDGYIFVVQNLRGRFGSEGTFELSSKADLENPKATSETTDAYDSIDWLVKHVANNNGKVGMFGVSYDGLTSAMTLLRPHPALKAISEQASPADQWMNDDDHRYGALRESYAFEYAVYEQADKNANTHFDFETYDTYTWYLSLGPLSNINAKYLHGTIPYWNSIVEHPDYDAFWKDEAWVTQVKGAFVPNLNVAGFWDQEDPWGPWEIFRRSELSDPNRYNFIVAGPWFHGQWHNPSAESIGQLPFGGHDTAVEFRERIEAPWFRYWLHGTGEKFPWKASTFQTGSNSWQTYRAWPPPATATSLYLRGNGTLTFEPPPAADSYVQYISDPANPVPYRARPISPTYPAGDWRRWEVADQRFVEHRPDVATWVSAPLDRDLVVTGELSADLFASTSGTDSDFVVKLIDVFPERAQPNAWNAESGPQPGQFAQSLNGYQLPIAMEVRRGRYNTSYEHPQPLVANQPAEFVIPLRSHDHVFLKGHRLMVQVQSTWFPLIDRNPQTFVPSIYAARAEDFVAATQRVYTSREHASHIVLPVIR